MATTMRMNGQGVAIASRAHTEEKEKKRYKKQRNIQAASTSFWFTLSDRISAIRHVNSKYKEENGLIQQPIV